MSETHPIEKEILDATHLAREGKESRAAFVLRMIKFVSNEMPEDDWDQLSEPTQAWVNTAVEKLQAKESLPDYPGIDGGNPVPVVPPAKPKKKKAETKPKTKAARANPKSTGVTEKIKRIMLSYPDISKADLVKRLEIEGIKDPSENTINAFWSDMRQTIRIAKEPKIAERILEWVTEPAKKD